MRASFNFASTKCTRTYIFCIAYSVKLATGNAVGIFCVFIITFFGMAKKMCHATSRASFISHFALILLKMSLHTKQLLTRDWIIIYLYLSANSKSSSIIYVYIRFCFNYKIKAKVLNHCNYDNEIFFFKIAEILQYSI